MDLRKGYSTAVGYCGGVPCSKIDSQLRRVWRKAKEQTRGFSLVVYGCLCIPPIKCARCCQLGHAGAFGITSSAHPREKHGRGKKHQVSGIQKMFRPNNLNKSVEHARTANPYGGWLDSRHRGTDTCSNGTPKRTYSLQHTRAFGPSACARSRQSKAAADTTAER